MAGQVRKRDIEWADQRSARICACARKLARDDININKTRDLTMDISRRLAILIFCGVPAIVGGGIVYGAFGSLTAMWIYEVLLLVTAGAFISR